MQLESVQHYKETLMWQTTESCRQCEKLSVLVESPDQIQSIREVPNTYDSRDEKFIWKFHEFMGYGLVPQSIDGQRATIDLYLCIDEDDLDDIDVRGYADRFLSERIPHLWKNVRILSISEPVLATPSVLPCRKLRHNIRIGDEI